MYNTQATLVVNCIVFQDNFTFSDEYTTAVGVYDAISDVQENHVVTHENDRAWRDAVVTNKPSLLALRYTKQPFQ